MATANEQIRDALVRHQAGLVTLSNRYGKIINKMIAETEPELQGYLARALPRVTPNTSSRLFQTQTNKMAVDISRIRRFGTLSIQKKIQQANRLNGVGIEGAQFWYTVEMKELAEREIQYIDNLIKDSVGFNFPTRAVPQQAILNAVSITPYSGGSIPKWFTSLKTNDINRIMSSVRFGLSQNDTPNTIIRGVFNTNIPTTMRDAERLARTCTNGVANQAKADYYKVNEDIISGYVYTATLDGRTSPQCSALDNTRWSKIEDATQPPIHPSCRSVLTPYLDKFGIVGDRPAVGGTNFRQEARKNYINRWENKGLSNKQAREKWNGLQQSSINSLQNKERRAFANKLGRDVIGKVPADVKYGDWLKTQPRSFINDTLGKSDAALFVDGKLPIKAFVSKDNRKLTLKELYRKDSEAFKLAGLPKPK